MDDSQQGPHMREDTIDQYRIGQLEQGLRDERQARRDGDAELKDEMGKVRVALYALSGTTIGSCLIIVIGQILLLKPS